MDRGEQAVNFHHKGYNCAQAVACAFADKTDLDIKTLFRLTEGFGSGMADTYGTCGAVSGAVVIIGLLNSTGHINGAPYSKAETYKIVKNMIADFRAKNGAAICRDLKGIDTKKVLRSCDGCIEDSVNILEKTIDSRHL